MKLFRNKRVKSIGNSKFSKYLLYALGEVLLIVAGLFIAVQLNNWNEQKKYNERTDKLLTLMQGELVSNVQYVNYFVPLYQKQDSLVAKVIKNEFTAEDYRNDESIYSGIFLNIAYPYSKSTFNELNEHLDEVPPELSEIYGYLRYIYVSLYDNNIESSKILSEFTTERNKNLMKTKPWAYKRFEDDVPDEYYNYLANDSYFKNEAAEYWNMTYSNEHYTIEVVKNYSILAYEAIENYLRKKSGNDEIFKYYKEDNFKHILGDYVSLKDSINASITYEDNALMYVEDDVEKYEFHYVNDSTYTFKDGLYFFTLKRKDSTVVGLKKQRGTERVMFNKL